jgi:hypothetical protein
MKSCEVLLLVFVAFSSINASAAEKECPERAIAVETEEGRLCICTKGYFGDNCQLNGKISHTCTRNLVIN